MRNLHGQSAPPGPLARLAALVLGAILLVLGFMFSLVLIAIVAVVALAAWGYFWWKTRALRQAMRERPAGGHVIDGEAVVVDEPQSSRITSKDNRRAD